MADHNKSEIQTVIEKNKAYNTNIETKKGENEVLHKQDLAYKTRMYEKQRLQEDNLKEQLDKKNPINNKINEMSITNA